MLTALKKACSSLLIAAIFALSLHIPVANAAMVSTAELAHSATKNADRARLSAFLDRADVQKQLQALGVDPAQAKSRVASLTDDEVKMLNAKLNQLPAGGDGVIGTVVGAVVLIFIILLITDILGLTDVFGFVNHPVHHHAHDN
ncbi:MAG TPA: PA2779 family protein [Mariprofundaceae bacterium]|nr:PA2779 family protein [Mariprofundaceae bacterium]